MKKFLLLIFLFSLFLLPTLVSADTNLPFETTVSGSISSSNTEDVYKISVPNKGTIRAMVQATNSGVSIELRDSNNKIVEQLHQYYRGGPNDPTWTQPVLLDSGEYYFHVKKREEIDRSEYSLLLSYLTADTNEIEPNQTKEEAMTLEINGERVKGLIYGDDETDFYKIVVTQPGRLWMNLKSSYGSIGLYPENLESSIDLEEISRADYGATQEVKWFTDLEAGVYYFRVYGPGLYDIGAAFTPAYTNETEPNNSKDSATSISAGKDYSGFLSVTDTDDFYKFEMPYDGFVTINYSSEFSTFYFSVPLYIDDKGQLDKPYLFSKRIELLKGTYYFQPHKYRVGGVYTFSFNLEPEIGLNFTDIPSNYFPAVKYLLMQGATTGLTSKTFGTSEKIKRVDAAVLLANILKLDVSDETAPPFLDVPKRAWGSINALRKVGIMGGKTSIFFGANEYVTRGEMALVLNRSYYFDVYGPDLSFTDVPSKYYLAVHHLVNNNITKGKTPTTFGTSLPITRGEMAIFLHRASTIKKKV